MIQVLRGEKDYLRACGLPQTWTVRKGASVLENPLLRQDPEPSDPKPRTVCAPEESIVGGSHLVFGAISTSRPRVC
jgi:hypothetical protein